MARILKDWIKGYIEYQKEAESPLSYITWIAVSCVAGAMQRRIWLPWSGKEIYGNMYIVLIGPSGLGKGQAMSPAMEIFQQLELPTAPNRVTIQDLLKRMDEQTTYFPGPNATTDAGVPMSAMQIFSGEWVVLLGKRDIDKIGILTDLYDSLDYWQNSTKWKGVDSLHNVYLNKLAGAAPDWIAQILPEESYGGGFTSRIIFVIENRLRQINPIPAFNHWHEKRREDLIHDLKQIANPEYFGAFTPDEEWIDLYIAFDRESKEAMDTGKYAIPDPLFQGYCRRRSLHLRKLSLIFAVARGENLRQVQAQDFKRALKLLKYTERNMPGLFTGTGRNPLEAVTESVMRYMKLKGDCTRQEILSKYRRDLDDESILKVERMLLYMKFLSGIQYSKDGNNARYKVNPEGG